MRELREIQDSSNVLIFFTCDDNDELIVGRS